MHRPWGCPLSRQGISPSLAGFSIQKKLTRREPVRTWDPAPTTTLDPVTGIVEDETSSDVLESAVDNVQLRLVRPRLGYDAFSETSVALASYAIPQSNATSSVYFLCKISDYDPLGESLTFDGI